MLTVPHASKFQQIAAVDRLYEKSVLVTILYSLFKKVHMKNEHTFDI